MRILVSVFEERQAEYIKKGLEAGNFVVDVLNLEEALIAAHQFDYDLAILEWTPRVDAPNMQLAHFRLRNPYLPILALVTSQDPEQRGKALELGADDCMTMPFSFNEFSARVHALLRRRSRSFQGEVLRAGDVELDWTRRIVTRGGRRIDLSPKEFALIAYLMENAGRPLTRAKILDHVWGLSFDPMSNVVDVCVCYLRRKVDNGFDRQFIQTIRGVGYQLDIDFAKPAAHGKPVNEDGGRAGRSRRLAI